MQGGINENIFGVWLTGFELFVLNHGGAVYIINAKHCISPKGSFVYTFGE